MFYVGNWKECYLSSFQIPLNLRQSVPSSALQLLLPLHLAVMRDVLFSVAVFGSWVLVQGSFPLRRLYSNKEVVEIMTQSSFWHTEGKQTSHEAATKISTYVSMKAWHKNIKQKKDCWKSSQREQKPKENKPGPTFLFTICGFIHRSILFSWPLCKTR